MYDEIRIWGRHYDLDLAALHVEIPVHDLAGCVWLPSDLIAKVQYLTCSMVPCAQIPDLTSSKSVVPVP